MKRNKKNLTTDGHKWTQIKDRSQTGGCNGSKPGEWLKVLSDGAPICTCSSVVIFLFLTITLLGCAGPKETRNGPLDETAAARKLYVAKCAKCHKFYDPKKYSDEEWHKWMRKMSKKSKLTPEQEALLSQYIDETYRMPSRTNSNP